MSRHNRERRKWRCVKCGAKLSADMGAAAARLMAADRARHPVADQITVHQCYHCRTLMVEGPGRMRAMTPAELLRLNVEAPQVAAAAETLAAPGGCIVVGG